MRNGLFALCVLGFVAVAPLQAQSTEVKLVTKDSVKKEKPSKPKSGGANYITQAELAASGKENMYEAIQVLRPQMLRPSRGASSFGAGQGQKSSTEPSQFPEVGGPNSSLPSVYLDNAKFGEIESLRNVETGRVKEVRLLSAADATTRFGTGVTGGVILLVTK